MVAARRRRQLRRARDGRRGRRARIAKDDEAPVHIGHGNIGRAVAGEVADGQPVRIPAAVRR